jgi:hypothetical protein
MPRETLTWEEMAARAPGFLKGWAAARREIGESQGFVKAFLEVFGITDPREVGEFEHEVPGPKGSPKRMDYLWKGVIGVEMKSKGKSLVKAMSQLEGYIARLPEDEAPALRLACDFEGMFVKNAVNGDSQSFSTRDLGRHLRLFSPLAGEAAPPPSAEQPQADAPAAGMMARLHDAMKRHGYGGHALEVCLVRLLFCMFAEDTGIFPERAFEEYVKA